MSKTATEFIEAVLAAIPADVLRKSAATDKGDALSLAMVIVDRVVRQLGDIRVGVACLEMVKFRLMISNLPEAMWPKPNILKGGDE